jgi:hypothetical protein
MAFANDESHVGTPKLGVLGFVHHAPPPAAELLDDAIVRDGFVDYGVGQ